MEENYIRKIAHTRDAFTKMGSKQTKADLFEFILHDLVKLFDAGGSAIYVYHPEANELTLVAIHNLRESLIGARVSADRGLLGQVVKNLQPMKIDDYKTWPGRVKVFEEDQYSALLEAPLLWKDDLFGVVGLVRTGEKRSFSDFDLDLLGVIAIHLAAVLSILK
jgi:signal transduction protein with GAF and PtsI domain